MTRHQARAAALRQAPWRGRNARSVLSCIAALALSLALAACQSSAVDDALDVEKDKASGVPAGLETVGSGAVTIGMITGLAGAAKAAERDRRDGAKLAAKELGSDQVTLAIYNARPATADIKAGIEALREKGARIVIGSVRADLAGSLAGDPSADRPPVVAMVSNGAARGNGVYAFLFDEIDGAAETAAYAVGAGRKRIVLVHAPKMEKTALERLRRGIEAEGGTISAALAFPAVGGEQFAGDKAALQNADAVMLAPGLERPGVALAALRATGALAPAALILGSADMPAERTLSGMFVCRVDQLAVGDLTERFRTEFGRPMSKDAAYGFDAAALAIGIVRARGGDGLTAATLRARSGFRGLLGAFRFTESGAVERHCSIYRVADGKFQLQDPAPEGF
ncbi:ABC transporter substrate-binding protein [Nitratireductor sp. ZSWI3]|uniref:ABC transporter substrate-binding protein n=1 Tax=Nitratireductor sp. ZSWI3 TaxID=2966359 RepID=UPI00214FE429|nr:ABC transporter substrate-binding protein [Nitratireductor sp. ZSWI3]MCR4268055.1 ABC transporter substrate-binding protein [Nitratireductor sp. ZSWI3]